MSSPVSQVSSITAGTRAGAGSAQRVAQSNPSQRRIYRLPQVMEATGFKRAWIYALMERDEFPKSAKIGARAVGWDADLIDQWVADRLDGVI